MPRSRLGDRHTLLTAVPKFVFAMALAACILLFTYTRTRKEFPASELLDIAALGAAVNTLLLLGALVFLRAKTRNAALSFIVVISVVSGYFVHIDLHLTGDELPLLLGTLAVWGGVFGIFELIDEHRWMAVSAPSFALLIAAALFFAASQEADWGDGDYGSQVRPISFEEKPNLYFLSFDGLAPQSVTQEYLGIETSDFMNLLNSELRRFPNMFSDSIWTRNSLNTLMSLDPDIYWSTFREVGDPGFITGQSPSPLADILNDNGYSTKFLYHDGYFGTTVGPHFDSLELEHSIAVCDRLDPSIRRIAFWGYCNLPSVTSALSEEESGFWTMEQLIRIVRTADQRGPQFVLSSVLVPGHALISLDYRDPADLQGYREQYLDRSNGIAGLMEELLVALRDHDPDAILFVFADHGLKLSHQFDFDNAPRFVVQDRFAIFGGVYPRDACASWFDETLSHKPWITTLDAVHTILRCLTGGEEALVEPLGQTVHADALRALRSTEDPRFRPPSELSFADFLYE